MRVCILDKGGAGMDKIIAWLAENPGIREVSVIKDPDEFVTRVEREPPEMVFIRLGSYDIPGLTVGQMVKEIIPDIKVVFVAEERDYALDAFEVGAYGYLLCPVERNKLEKILFTIGQKSIAGK